MAATNNFAEFNVSASNIETDNSYQGDSTRTGGAVTGPFLPQLANKVFLQSSRMVAALALALQNKGYSTTDGTTPFQASTSPSAAVTALAAVLANIVTTADLVTAVSIGTFGGYVKFGSALGSLIIQWGQTGSLSSGGNTISFPTTFVSHDPVVMATQLSASGSASFSVSGVNFNNFSLYTNTTATEFYWFAIGN